MRQDAAEMFAMGAQALEAQNLAAAEQHFRAIVEADPRAHEAWNALSVVTVRSGVPDIAAQYARRALELDRRNPVYLNNLGVAYGELGRFAEAEQAFRRALKLTPVYAEGLFNLGRVLHKQDRLLEAVRALERAYAINQHFPGLHASLCQLYRKQGRPQLAMEVLRQAPRGGEEWDLAPAFAECLAELEGPESAIRWLSAMVARDPDWHVLRFSLAAMLLSLGQWRAGWREYAWRPNLASERGNELPAPLPQDLRGVHLRLKGEQGLGDTLFFLRFVPELRSRGASIGLACARKLHGVLSRRDLFDEIVDDETRYDLWCGDLPLLLDSTATPGPLPLAGNAQHLESCRCTLAGLGPGPYLAITWRAGTDVLRGQEFGANRALLMKEIPLDRLGEALRGWPGTLVAVQRGPRAGEFDAVRRAANAPVHDLSALNEDLPQMLALLAAVDEYVCVSNTNVHMIAGLGRTARVLVPYPPEWRWMRGNGGSAWFPRFPVYRQPQSRDWGEPLARLRADLLS
jgi:Tfp pilus assembly protein PilF